MRALTATVGKLTRNMQQLEDVLLVLLESKEEQARQEAQARKEKELLEEKNKFMSHTHTHVHTAQKRHSQPLD